MRTKDAHKCMLVLPLLCAIIRNTFEYISPLYYYVKVQKRLAVTGGPWGNIYYYYKAKLALLSKYRFVQNLHDLSSIKLVAQFPLAEFSFNFVQSLL